MNDFLKLPRVSPIAAHTVPVFQLIWVVVIVLTAFKMV